MGLLRGLILDVLNYIDDKKKQDFNCNTIDFNPILDEIPCLISKIREKRGISHDKLASELDILKVNGSILCLLEKGNWRPKKDLEKFFSLRRKLRIIDMIY